MTPQQREEKACLVDLHLGTNITPDEARESITALFIAYINQRKTPAEADALIRTVLLHEKISRLILPA